MPSADGQPARAPARYNCRMNLLELTLPTAAENLALDEALLETAEAARQPCETLRLWEPAAPLVVLGRASRVAREVDIAACREMGVPIYRRRSGGAAIVTGAGCLMYAVVLSYELRPHLRMIDEAHRFVLDTLAAGLQPLRAGTGRERIQRRGLSDLTVDGHRKFSGNSLRCGRTHLLYHGTLLYNFPLEWIEKCLLPPPRSPDYRAGRSHGEFVANLNVPRESLRTAVIKTWRQTASFDGQGRTGFPSRPANTANLDAQRKPAQLDWPRELTARLAADKYSTDAWNLGR